MHAVMVLAALACPGDWGWYAHGYGSFFPRTTQAGGVVLPPAWPDDPTPWPEWQRWDDYVQQLEGYEREEMARVWKRATPEARKTLLVKLADLEVEAAAYRAKVEKERALERSKLENRPLTEEERALWKRYLSKAKDDKRKDALERWRKADNRARRVYLQEILKEMQEQLDRDGD